MKALWLIGCTLLGLIGGRPLLAQEASQIMVDLSQMKGQNLAQVRVKIFPHDREYKPHGMDVIRDRIAIESEKPCALYRASAEKIAAIGGVKRRASSFALNAAELSEPQIIQCPGAFRLIRQGLPLSLSFEYTGRLYVRPLVKGEQRELEAINVVDLQEYLRGVVPSEVYREWPMETLKTQAVAARTYAIYHTVYARRFHSDRLWDVDDTINFQAYTGTALLNPRTDEAVLQTDGQILTYQGQVIQAYYHADSGGQTEEAFSVWSRPVPFTVARPEAHDMELAKPVWERELSLADIERDLRSIAWLDEEQTIKQLLVPVIGRTPSGRVRSLTVVDQKGRFKLVPFSVFRRIVPQLPSQLFMVEKSREKPGHVIIKGIGNGHGVGMSQMGAAALAGEKAWTYQQILEYYYVRTTLCTLLEKSENYLPNCYQERGKYAEERPVGGAPI